MLPGLHVPNTLIIHVVCPLAKPHQFITPKNSGAATAKSKNKTATSNDSNLTSDMYVYVRAYVYTQHLNMQVSPILITLFELRGFAATQ